MRVSGWSRSWASSPPPIRACSARCRPFTSISSPTDWWRYQTRQEVDGLPPGEGAFLPCTFWLADNLALQGRVAEARETFERLLTLRSDVGLLSEEYDSGTRRLLGNFPQAFTHMSLINTAGNLTGHGGPAEHRPDE